MGLRTKGKTEAQRAVSIIYLWKIEQNTHTIHKVTYCCKWWNWMGWELVILIVGFNVCSYYHWIYLTLQTKRRFNANRWSIERILFVNGWNYFSSFNHDWLYSVCQFPTQNLIVFETEANVNNVIEISFRKKKNCWKIFHWNL